MQKLAFAPLQIAIFQHLTNDDVLMGEVNGIFDHVLTDTPLPYITLTNFDMQPQRTKTSRAQEITFAIQIWSGYDGNAEAYQLMELVWQSLTSTPVMLPDGSFVGHFSDDSMNVINEVNNEGRRGLIRVRALLMQK